MVSRICLDVLRSRTTRHEEAWPDEADFVKDPGGQRRGRGEAGRRGRPSDDRRHRLAHPAERLAYVLKDVFDLPFDAIARVLGRTEVGNAAGRRRARRRLREPEPREDLAAADAAVVDAFMQAARDNEFEALLDLLDPDAAVRSDDAAMAMGGDAGTVLGGRAVAEFFAGRARAALPATLFDGGAAACWQYKGEVKVVFGFTVVHGKVVEIEVLADPDVITRAARRSPGPIVSTASASTISPRPRDLRRRGRQSLPLRHRAQRLDGHRDTATQPALVPDAGRLARVHQQHGVVACLARGRECTFASDGPGTTGAVAGCRRRTSRSRAAGGHRARPRPT